jgi:XTP/dITP diphosphohydrolase
VEKLLIATNNADKLCELGALLGGLPFALLRPADLGLELAVAETGRTYAANARRKAEAFARASGLLALADDSGLELPALGGWPGVYSNRFAGPTADAAERLRLVLDRLAGRTNAERRARFVAVVALAGPGGRLAHARGTLAGVIAPAPRGLAGFGYDPIFIPRGETRTLAEMAAAEKNGISHRARAIARLLPRLRALAGESPWPGPTSTPPDDRGLR